MIDMIKYFFAMVGVGVVLQFYAFMVAYGAALGWSMVKRTTTLVLPNNQIDVVHREGEKK